MRKQRGYHALLEEMSPEMRGKVLALSCGKWLSVLPFLRPRLTGKSLPAISMLEAEFKGFLNALAPQVNMLAFPPLEVILLPNQAPTAM